jgi:hypothetical protein
MGAIFSTLRSWLWWGGNAEQRQETSVIGGQSPRNSISPDDDNIIEGVVAKFSEMKDGESVTFLYSVFNRARRQHFLTSNRDSVQDA